MRCVSTAGSRGHFGEPGPLAHVFSAGVSTEWPVTGTFTGSNYFPAPGKVLSIPKKLWAWLEVYWAVIGSIEHVTRSRRGELT